MVLSPLGMAEYRIGFSAQIKMDPDLRQEDGVYKSEADSVEATPLPL